MRKPFPNEKWVLKDDSPWPRTDIEPVLVTDVRDGWVRYDVSKNLFTDQRLEIESFIQCYTFYE